MKRTRILINNFLYLDLSILEISSIVIYEIGYDYVKPKYGEKAKLCYMDTNNFMAYKKSEYIYSDILKDVETISDTSNYKLDKPLPKGKKSYLINERWTRRENYSRVCCIKTKNIQLLNRW